ncbi:hypothetical protein BJX99DRAFT_228852 [Aspergillus californicus]
MAYAVVAIQFQNGTTRDLGRLDGSPEYLAAMAALAEDIGTFRSFEAAMEHTQTHPAKRTFYPAPFIRDWWRALQDLYLSILHEFQLPLPADTHYPPPDPYLPDKWVDIVADTMLSQIKSDIMTSVHPPLKYFSVVTSWPDFESGTNSLYSMRFRRACALAGLEHIAGNTVSYYALEYDGIAVDESKKWVEQSYKPSGPQAMLVLSYNAASLDVTLNTRKAGVVSPTRLLESPSHGAFRHNGSEGYWHEVKQLIEDVVQEQVVDHLLLLGSHALNTDFIQVVGEVIKKHDNINSAILGRYISSGEEFVRDEDLPIFAAARQAAVLARRGMETGLSKEGVYCDVHEEL